VCVLGAWAHQSHRTNDSTPGRSYNMPCFWYPWSPLLLVPKAGTTGGKKKICHPHQWSFIGLRDLCMFYPHNPVYTRSVDTSVLEFSLSSNRHPSHLYVFSLTLTVSLTSQDKQKQKFEGPPIHILTHLIFTSLSLGTPSPVETSVSESSPSSRVTFLSLTTPTVFLHIPP
jgi:hypothetical protein